MRPKLRFDFAHFVAGLMMILPMFAPAIGLVPQTVLARVLGVLGPLTQGLGLLLALVKGSIIVPPPSVTLTGEVLTTVADVVPVKLPPLLPCLAILVCLLALSTVGCAGFNAALVTELKTEAETTAEKNLACVTGEVLSGNVSAPSIAAACLLPDVATAITMADQLANALAAGGTVAPPVAGAAPPIDRDALMARLRSVR